MSGAFRAPILLKGGALITPSFLEKLQRFRKGVAKAAGHDIDFIARVMDCDRSDLNLVIDALQGRTIQEAYDSLVLRGLA